MAFFPAPRPALANPLYIEDFRDSGERPAAWAFYCQPRASSCWSVVPDPLLSRPVLQSTRGWSAALYLGRTFSSASCLSYSALVDLSHGIDAQANLVWDVQGATLDGSTRVGCYVFSFHENGKDMALRRDWSGGKGQGETLAGAGRAFSGLTHTVSVLQRGSSLSCFVDGSQVMAATDSSYASGYIGLQTGDPGPRWAGVDVDDGVVFTPTRSPVESPTPTYSPTPSLTPSLTPTPTDSPTVTPCMDRDSVDLYVAPVLGDRERGWDSAGPDGPLIVDGQGLSFAAWPPPPNGGAYSVGGWSPAGFLRWSAAQNAAFSNLRKGGIELEFYPTRIRRLDTPVSWRDSHWGSMFIQLDTAGRAPWAFISELGEIDGTRPLKLDAWNDLKVEWDGQRIYLFLNGTLDYRGYGVGFKTDTVTEGAFGCRYQPGLPGPDRAVAGYLCQMRFLKGDGVPSGGAAAPDRCGAPPAPTLTPYAVFAPSPTPDVTAVPDRAPPWPQVFTVAPSPVLVPTTVYEGGPQGWVQEAYVGRFRYPDGLWHMTYSAGKCPPEAIALATSPSLAHGGVWTRVGVIIGDGAAPTGIAHDCAMSTQLTTDKGATYRTYYSDRDTGDYMYVSSHDGGYTYVSPVVAIRASQLAAYALVAGEYAGINSVGIVQDPVRPSVWWAAVEVGTRVSYKETPNDLTWLFKSTDGADSFQVANPPSGTLWSLSPDPHSGQDLQGPRSLIRTGNIWDLWFGFGTPKIFHAWSADLQNWFTDKRGTVAAGDPPQGRWLPAVDQVADPAVVQSKGNTYLYFSVNDNRHGRGVIACAVYHGTMEDYDRGMLPKEARKPQGSARVSAAATY